MNFNVEGLTDLLGKLQVKNPTLSSLLYQKHQTYSSYHTVLPDKLYFTHFSIPSYIGGWTSCVYIIGSHQPDLLQVYKAYDP